MLQFLAIVSFVATVPPIAYPPGLWPLASFRQGSATVGWEAGQQPQPTVEQDDGESGHLDKIQGLDSSH